MPDRLEIKIEGTLPDKGKFAIVGAAEAAVETFAAQFSAEHGIELTVSVKAVRPNAKKAAPAVEEVPGAHRRHAAE